MNNTLISICYNLIKTTCKRISISYHHAHADTPEHHSSGDAIREYLFVWLIWFNKVCKLYNWRNNVEGTIGFLDMYAYGVYDMTLSLRLRSPKWGENGSRGRYQVTLQYAGRSIYEESLERSDASTEKNVTVETVCNKDYNDGIAWMSSVHVMPCVMLCSVYVTVAYL